MVRKEKKRAERLGMSKAKAGFATASKVSRTVTNHPKLSNLKQLAHIALHVSES